MPLVNGFSIPGEADLAFGGMRSPRLLTGGLCFAVPASDEKPSTVTGLLVDGGNSPLFFADGYDGSTYVDPYTEEMLDWREFFSHVLPWVKGCPDVTIIDHCIKATRLFCAKTLVWQVHARVAMTADGRDTYGLDLLDIDRIKMGEGAQVGDQHFQGTDRASAERTRQSHRHCREVSLDDARHLRVNNADAGQHVHIDLALKPQINAPGFPTRLGLYIDDIAHGAIATLSLLPRQEWSSKDQAVAHRDLFMARIGAVGYNTSKGFRKTGHKPYPGQRLL